MRILIDECLPRQLKIWLTGKHEAITAQEAGWAGIKNGKLLRLASESGFDVFVTADKNMYYQENFSNLKICAVVIPSNRKALVERSVGAFIQSLEHVLPGQKIILDLGKDANIWQSMQLHAIEHAEHHTTHVFKPQDGGG